MFVKGAMVMPTSGLACNNTSSLHHLKVTARIQIQYIWEYNQCLVFAMVGNCLFSICPVNKKCIHK